MMNRWSKLKKNEDGALTIFAVMTYITMIMLSGFAIDLARLELERTKTQLAVDNAALAAASLLQSVDAETGLAKTPSQVVDLYMAKADVSEKFRSTYRVVEDETTVYDTSRSVYVSGTDTVSSIFMDLAGVKELDFSIQSAALESELVPTEVSLVLDISGSMVGTNKLPSLVTGAKEFVTAMLAGNSEANPNNVSISLIPYSAYVNSGKDLSAVFEGTYKDFGEKLSYDEVKGEYSNDGLCGYFDDAAFDTVTQWNSSWFVPVPTYGYYNYSSSTYTYGTTGNYVNTPWCPAMSWSEILPVSNDETELHSRLDQLLPTTNTSIDDGALWGAVLLDPSVADEIKQMTNGGYKDTSGFPAGRITTVMETFTETDEFGLEVSYTEAVDKVSSSQDVDPGFDGRPLPYGAANKILVIMTDGYNTSQYRLKDSYSKLWNDGSTDWAKRGSYFFHWRDSDNRLITHSSQNLTGYGYQRLRWQDLFALRPVWEIASFSKNWNTNTFQYVYRSHSQKNTRLWDICKAARNAGVTIYTITYEASSYSAKIMDDKNDSDVSGDDRCASTGASYVATESTISAVFGNIAQSARKLQLTQ